MKVLNSVNGRAKLTNKTDPDLTWINSARAFYSAVQDSALRFPVGRPRIGIEAEFLCDFVGLNAAYRYAAARVIDVHSGRVPA